MNTKRIIACWLVAIIVSIGFGSPQSSQAQNAQAQPAQITIDGLAVKLPFQPGAEWRVTAGWEAANHQQAWNYYAVDVVPVNQACLGRPILAMAHGFIESNNGHELQIDHRVNNYRSLYSHLDTVSPGLAVGTEVFQGQQIGTCGGYPNFAPHLHFQIFQGARMASSGVIPIPIDGITDANRLRSGQRGLYSTNQSQPQLPTANYRPLRLFWHGERGDNFTTASTQAEISAAANAYTSIRTEGFVFSHAGSGRVPLQQYWHSGRGDNILVATNAGINDARNAGYSFVRTEGYIYATQQQHTVPLKLFWSDTRQDNFTTSTAEGEQSALAAGYSFVRIEGYVFVARPLQLYWHSDRGDNFPTATSEGIASAHISAYGFIRTEGYVFADHLPDTVPLKLFWSDARQDNYITATAEGEQSALMAGYGFVRIEGYVLPTNGADLRPLELFYHDGRGDNFTTGTVAGATDAINHNYQLIRHEGYIYGTLPAGY
ncbi:MAG TPA: M23 family peptidase [Herpetosiphon sp.]|uniref:Peptidase M23B n=1 Tax=Herpetosiphon aurantiacus (strain ATCC 23779 / DSM 785 / 114-95) TaxID=316274 RepID=A9B7W7_HERA2|nr:M23 family metallopeptidase [Herpetosiphon sp.]ABX04495.1 peptidase M23B [Herpetosiphon aurantiacus DSM 785]HBW52252.1 M23 family peptidase [Herpetosiphon sp.]